MRLTEIQADRLRNLRAVQLELDAGLTAIVGCNGQGKTSLLEAIYLLGTGRSFRTRRHEEIVPWAGGPLCVAGTVEKLAGRSAIAVVIDEGGKRLLVDGLETELDRFLGGLDVVDLTATRMAVLRGGPEERRRFLDRGVVGLQPVYLRALGEYRRVLQQRNALLRASDSGRETELVAWDDRLIGVATELHRRRREYATRLAAEIGRIGRSVFPDDADLTLHYQPSPRATAEAEPHEFAAVYGEALRAGRGRDRTVGHTCQGPHRDEMEVHLEGIDLRRFGSAGQVRAAMIALKLGKISLLRQERNEAPIFLLDDFDTDLDERRAGAVASFLQEGQFQPLLATAKEEMADRLGIAFRKVRVQGGEARTA